jgi:hypothetical protein
VEELLPEEDEVLEQPAIATAATGTAASSQRRDTTRVVSEDASIVMV